MPDDNQNTPNNDTGAVISDHTTPPPTDPTLNTTADHPVSTEAASMPVEEKNSAATNDSMQVISEEKKSFGKKKIIATIFGVFFLIGGVAAGVFLVQRQQNLEEKAASGSECTHAPECILFDNPGNAGSNSVPKTIKYLDITAKDYHRYNPGQTNDGCYNVSINGRDFSWQRVGDGPNCKDVSNIQVWMGEEQSSISASCEEVQAYDDDWNQLSMSQLAQLEPGDNVKFAVRGTAQGGTINKARFRVNSSEWQETTNLKPGEASTYFINFTIPEDTKDFTVNAQVHLSENDNWY